MKRYMIYCCPSAGGLFFSTVVAQTLGHNVVSQFSASGHAHNMGRGNWRGANNICLIGDHWELNYRPNQLLYYSHVMPGDFNDKNPDIEIIKIVADQSDYRKITELLVKKAWPDFWTKKEYDKWVGPDYPPYSPDNIPNSEIIVNDLGNDLEFSTIAQWFDQNNHIKHSYSVNFRTVMGVDDKSLTNVVESIVGKPVSQSTKKYILEYQQLNQSLYFNV